MALDETEYMRLALAEAAAAASAGDVPVGAVIVRDGAVIARAANRTVRDQDPTAHAEVLAIRQAASVLGSWRLDACTLCVTLEPCAMCAGAIVLARIDALRFAAEDPKGGGVIHGARIFAQPTCHHRPDVLGGIGEAEAAAQLRHFFLARR